jgi:hypothetical protein
MASQDADKFLTTGTNETNFAELAECGVHFSPQTLWFARLPDSRLPASFRISDFDIRIFSQAACTASQWKSTPRLRQIPAIAFTGNKTPVSLFAHINDTTAVSSVIAFSKSASFNNPSRSTGR